MSEPPRKTGAERPAVVLGKAKAPSLPARAGLSFRITPVSQPPPMIIAAWPLAKTASWSGWFVLRLREAGEESVFWICLKALRPAIDCDDVSEPCHLPPRWVAMSPPRSQISGSAAYQYLPGQ